MSNHRTITTFYPHDIREREYIIYDDSRSRKEHIESLMKRLDGEKYEVCKSFFVWSEKGIYEIKKVY